MATKSQMINLLGADELLLPRMISDALVANDRVKYLFSLVQAAKAHADSPDAEPSDLRSERLASGVNDEGLDRVTRSAVLAEDGRYQIPQLGRIVQSAASCIEEMIRPLELADPPRKASAAKYRERLEKLKASIGSPEDEVATVAMIERMTSGRPVTGDSLHLLVMDLHREINALQSATYQESVDGASVYGITDDDKVLVKAFMKGINRNAKLKFDHPGLGTTSTRSGGVLMIQNDIGQTEAHVVVIKVKESTASITYTDVHRQRFLFLRSMLEKFPVAWTDAVSKEDSRLKGESEYYLSTGTYQAKDRTDLEEFLAFLGSRLVFLIDWNRARKQLKLFLPKGEVFDTLRWAADNDIGHMGFLKMGGDKLVLGAIEQSANAPLRFGDQFYDVLGKKRASDFLRFVFATCSEGLRQNKSEVLIRDEVRAELAECFHSVNEDLLEIASRHSSLIVELATAVRDDLLRIEGGEDQELAKRAAEKGKKWESEADALLNKVRLEVKRSNAPPAFEVMLSHADDAADSLEDSLFLLTLAAGDHIKGPLGEPLLDLAEVSTRASMEFLKAVEGAKAMHRWSPREDIGDFLEAVDKVMSLEHDADEANRQVKEALTAKATDFKQMQIISEISKDIEQSTDALMKSAITLKDYVLKDVVGA